MNVSLAFLLYVGNLYPKSSALILGDHCYLPFGGNRTQVSKVIEVNVFNWLYFNRSGNPGVNPRIVIERCSIRRKVLTEYI